MSAQKQIQGLIKRLENSYQGTPWYGNALLSSLRKISSERAKMQVKPGTKSIAALLRHMVAWRQFLIEHLQGNNTFDIELNSEIDWPSVDDLTWEELVEELEISQTNILHLLSQQEDSWLKEMVGNRTYNHRFLVEGVIQHDIYHLGQINLLNNLI
ncbi:MAG: DinB family protein [Saprospiraceae bacterium]